MTELLISPSPERYRNSSPNNEPWGDAEKTEVKQAPERAESLRLPGSLSERIQYAQERSSFVQSPEVSQAIEGFYTDHYALAGVIEKVIAGDTEGLESRAVDATIENPLIKHTTNELLTSAASDTSRGESLRRVEDALHTVLYQERSVAEETVDEPELANAIRLAEVLRETAVDEGFADKTVHPNGAVEYRWKDDDDSFRHRNPSMRKPEDILRLAERSRQSFWEDTRHAGQLEFHNTGNLLDIHGSGSVLRSRTRQRQLTGSFKSQMGIQNNRAHGMHSNVPHFSETYTYHEYKRDVFGGDESHPGTYAVPLAKLIETAPYARDSKYAVVEVNDPAKLDKIPINDATGSIGSGGDDSPGRFGNDRVFFADNLAEKANEAVSYDIELGDESFRLLTEDEAYETYANIGLGVGEHIPGELVVPVHKEKMLYASKEERDHMQTAMTDFIKKLQADYRSQPKYRNKVVVPLRSGVMEFEAEAQPSRLAHQAVVRHSALE